MPFERHLPDDEIHALHALVIQLGLAASRDALLGGLDAQYVASLPKHSAPGTQILSDLQQLNTCEAIGDPTRPVIPLARWLANAYRLRSVHGGAARFKEAQDAIEQRAERRVTEHREAEQRAIEKARTQPQAPPSPKPPSPPANPTMPLPLSTTPSPATAVFVSIGDLTRMPGPEVVDALSALHRLLRVPLAALPGSRALSSVTGGIILVPDTLNAEVHKAELLPAWLSDLDAAGLAVRAGVARGLVEWVVDADGTVNATGRCINIAARLAASNKNPGVLYDQSYVGPASGNVRRSHFLYPGKQQPISVEGKRDEVFTAIADPDFHTRAETSVPEGPDAPSVNAVLIAYDLPGFSEGDLRTLASRFRGVTAEIQRLREQHTLPPGAKVAFSPGGDGGVLSITGIAPERALSLATDLAGKLTDADETRSASASVRARIGVHYGPVQSYDNAEGVARPTGHALFEADGLAGDAEARSWDAIVVSNTLVEGPGARWQEIGPLRTSLGKQLRRFVDSRAWRIEAPAKHAAAPTKAAAQTPTSPFTLDDLARALLSAFPSQSDLQRMLAYGLDRNLVEIAAPGNLTHVVFELVQKAQAGGWLMDLVKAAREANPGNPLLKELGARVGL
jgi:class 3 adenylate cyclase